MCGHFMWRPVTPMACHSASCSTRLSFLPLLVPPRAHHVMPLEVQAGVSTRRGTASQRSELRKGHHKLLWVLPCPWALGRECLPGALLPQLAAGHQQETASPVTNPAFRPAGPVAVNRNSCCFLSSSTFREWFYSVRVIWRDFV